MQKSNRFVLPAAVLAVLFLLAGCVGRPKQNAAGQAQAETSGSGAPADSCEIPVRHNGACLALFELTGPVENCRVENWQTGTAEGEYAEADMMWSRDYGFNRRGYLVLDGCAEYTYRADTVFLYGEDAQAGMSASLTYDLGTLTHALQGLSVKGMLSYDYRMDNNEIFQREYSLYAPDPTTGSYLQKLYNNSSPNRLKREFYDRQQTLGQITINYDRTFNSVHKVGALVGWEVQKIKGDNFYAQRELAFATPYLFNGTSEGRLISRRFHRPRQLLCGGGADGLLLQAGEAGLLLCPPRQPRVARMVYPTGDD